MSARQSKRLRSSSHSPSSSDILTDTDLSDIDMTSLPPNSDEDTQFDVVELSESEKTQTNVIIKVKKTKPKKRMKSLLWTPEDDKILIESLKTDGRDFKKMATLFPHRTECAVIQRYYLLLQHGAIPRQEERSVQWTKQEDALLVDGWKQYGKDFKSIAALIPLRTEKAIEQRYYKLRDKHRIPLNPKTSTASDPLSSITTPTSQDRKERSKSHYKQDPSSASVTASTDTSSLASERSRRHRVRRYPHVDSHEFESPLPFPADFDSINSATLGDKLAASFDLWYGLLEEKVKHEQRALVYQEYESQLAQMRKEVQTAKQHCLQALCIQCHLNVRDTAFFPCTHMYLCQQCSNLQEVSKCSCGTSITSKQTFKVATDTETFDVLLLAQNVASNGS